MLSLFVHVIGCIVLNDFSRCMNLVSWECSVNSFLPCHFVLFTSCYCGDDSETLELSWEGNMWETIELVLLKHEWPHFPTHNVLCSKAWKVQLFFAKLWSIVRKKKKQKNLGWSSGVFQSCERIIDDWWDWMSIDVTMVFWLTWSVRRFFSQNKRVEFNSPRNSRGHEHGCRSVD